MPSPDPMSVGAAFFSKEIMCLHEKCSPSMFLMQLTHSLPEFSKFIIWCHNVHGSISFLIFLFDIPLPCLHLTRIQSHTGLPRASPWPVSDGSAPYIFVECLQQMTCSKSTEKFNKKLSIWMLIGWQVYILSVDVTKYLSGKLSSCHFKYSKNLQGVAGTSGNTK